MYIYCNYFLNTEFMLFNQLQKKKINIIFSMNIRTNCNIDYLHLNNITNTALLTCYKFIFLLELKKMHIYIYIYTHITKFYFTSNFY